MHTLQKIFAILNIGLSSELQSMDIDSCIATTFVKGIILSCSSNIIYEYHLKGKWTGAPSSGMDYGKDNGMYSWWHHCVLDSFVSSFQISKSRH